MAVAAGNPDWQNAIREPNFTILPAYQAPNQYFLLPTHVDLRVDAHGKPDFYLSFFSTQPTEEASDSLYAMINLGLIKNASMNEAFDFLRKQQPHATMVTASFAPTAYWHLETPKPPFVQPFAWQDVNTARIFQRLDLDLGLLIYNGMKAGAIVADAAVECEIAGLLPRLPLEVRFQIDELLQALQALSKDTPSKVPYQRVCDFFTGNPQSLPLTVEGDYEAIRPADFAQAMAGRVRMELGSFEPSPRISDGPGIGLRQAGDASFGGKQELTWNLATPVLALVPTMFPFDPFSEVLRQCSGGNIKNFTYFTQVPPLPNEMTTQRVLIVSGLPPGLQPPIMAIQLTFQVAKSVARDERGQQETVTLFPQSAGLPWQPQTVELHFKNPSDKSYSIQVTVITPQAPLKSEQESWEGDYVAVGSSRLPLEIFTVWAGSMLLDAGNVYVSYADASRVQLTNAQPSASYVQDPKNINVTVTVEPLNGQGRSVTIEVPAIDGEINLYSFPEYGPQVVDVTVSFENGSQTVVYEFAPEATPSSGRSTFAFTPSDNQANVTYIPTSLTQYFYRYRLVDPQGPAGKWSEPLSPQQHLSLTACMKEDPTMNLPEGFELEDAYCYPYGPTGNQTFAYIPGTPQIARTDGSPTANLTTSPAGATLAITLCWELDGNAQERMKHEIPTKYPDASRPKLEAGEFATPKVSLVVKEGGETLHTFEPISASGLGAQNATFNEALTAKEKDLVTAAFGGQSGNLFAQYDTELVLPSSIDVTISGDVAPDLKVLAPKKKRSDKHSDDPTLEECVAQLKKSIQAGTLKVEVTKTANLSPDTENKVTDEVIETIAKEDVLSMIESMGADAGTVSEYDVSRNGQERDPLSYSISRELDIGAWFARQGGGDALIQQSSSVLDEPPR